MKVEQVLNLQTHGRPASSPPEPIRTRSATSVEKMVARATAVLGWCLCLALCQVRGSYVPADMNRTIQNLLDHYVSMGGARRCLRGP